MALVFDPQKARQIDRACELLRRGHAVALPTETVYGLAARALDPIALAGIFSLKARPHFDPLIVHVFNLRSAERLIKTQTALHEKLVEKFWPGPLTLLFEKSAIVPDLCTAGSAMVALRSPAHPVFRAILEKLGEALAAPSANRFGRLSPTTAQAALDELGPFGLEAVVDGGACQWGLESTVIKIIDDTHVELVRPGAVSRQDLQECLEKKVELCLLPEGSGISSAKLHESPGQLKSHYAPQTPLFFLTETQAVGFSKTAVISNFALVSAYPLGATSKLWKLPWKKQEILSGSGSDIEAAAKLFGVLRALDQERLEGIVALAMDESGLGLAINDRLKRASHTM